MAAKKITRKELLKTPDEFLTFSEKAINYISNNSKKVITVVVVVVALLVIGFGTRAYLNHRAQAATTAYSNARSLLPATPDWDAKEAEPAIAALQDVADRFAGSPSGRCALLDLGNLYFRAGQYDRSEAAYQQFLKNISETEEAFRPMILNSLAYLYELKGDPQKAAESWRQVLALSGDLLKDEALVGIARVSLSQGRTDEGKKAYQDLVAQYPGSPYTVLAEARLASLGQAN